MGENRGYITPRLWTSARATSCSLRPPCPETKRNKARRDGHGSSNIGVKQENHHSSVITGFQIKMSVLGASWSRRMGPAPHDMGIRDITELSGLFDSSCLHQRIPSWPITSRAMRPPRRLPNRSRDNTCCPSASGASHAVGHLAPACHIAVSDHRDTPAHNPA